MAMQETYPLVSIGMPTYNPGSRILRALTSIAEQQYPNLEVIISDNCSTDNTKEEIAEICKRQPEIKYFRQEVNTGMINNFNFTLKHASGKYFIWLSDDDGLEPGALLKCVAFLERNPDYSLVSGKIAYWKDEVPDFMEGGFSFEQNSPGFRVIDFYFKVVYGGLFHGLMRRDLTKDIKVRSVIGNDYHFVANLAYQGKIKNFDFVGYNKRLGGTSRNFVEYAKALGESTFAGHFPHVKMASNAFAEVMHRSPVFSQRTIFSKFALAISSFSGILYCHYVKMVIGSRIRNFLRNPFYVLERLGLKVYKKG